MEKPTIYLTLNKTEQWNVQDFLKTSDSDETPFYGILDIANGHIVTKTPYGEWDFGLNGSVDGGGNPKFAIDAKLLHDEDDLELKGLIDMKAVGSLTVKSDHFAFNCFLLL